MYITDLILPLIALILGGFGAWLTAVIAHRLDLIDSPNERSSHSEPTPQLPANAAAPSGLFADRFHFSPRCRLAFQFSAALIVLVGIYQPEITLIRFIPLSIPLSIFIVGTANFYNFMDGINGIAATGGIIGFGLLGFYTLTFEKITSFTFLSACMASSCLGFLPFNMPKAKVFMGDVGSVLLGFVFATIILLLSNNFLDFVCLASFLFPFYADELTTMVVRIKDREDLLKPHRRHLYQLLANEQSVPHWKISTGFGIFQLVVGLTVLLAKSHGILVVLSLLSAFFIGFIFVSFSVRKKLTTTSQLAS